GALERRSLVMIAPGTRGPAVIPEGSASANLGGAPPVPRRQAPGPARAPFTGPRRVEARARSRQRRPASRSACYIRAQRKMKKVGIIGFRGMVGSVLVERMIAEQDFARIDAHFFSTSQHGTAAPKVKSDLPPVKDANDENALKAMDV